LSNRDISPGLSCNYIWAPFDSAFIGVTGAFLDTLAEETLGWALGLDGDTNGLFIPVFGFFYTGGVDLKQQENSLYQQAQQHFFS
jgi:hypothetical protein